MRKRSKKLVSILTILSFLLTLVPTVAFADNPKPQQDPPQSTIRITDETIEPGDDVTINVAATNVKENDTIKVFLDNTDGTAVTETVTADEAGDEYTKAVKVGNITDENSKVIVQLVRSNDLLDFDEKDITKPEPDPEPVVKSAAYVKGQEVAPGKDRVVKVAIENLEAGDTLEVLDQNDQSFDPAIVYTLKAADVVKDVIELKLDVPKTVKDGDDDVDLDALHLQLNDDVMAAPYVTVKAPVEEPAAFNTQGSYAYFKDGDTVDGIDVDAYENEKFILEFNDKNGRYTFYDGPIWIWAEVDKNQPDSRLRIKNNTGKDALGKVDVQDAGNNIYKVDRVVTDKYGEGVEFDLHFTSSGKYRVYVSTADPAKDNMKADGSFKSKPARFYAEGNTNIANVSGENEKVKAIGIESVNSPKAHETILECGAALWKSSISNRFYDRCCEWNIIPEEAFDKWILVDPNDTTKSKVNAYIYTEVKDENGKVKLDRVGKGKEVKISANRYGITIDPESVKTSRSGKVEFAITGHVPGEYLVYVEAGGCRVTVPVKVTPLRANDIEKVDEPDYPIAAGDNANSDALTFRILDVDGNVIDRPFSKISPIRELDGLRGQLKALSVEDGEYLHGPVYGVAYDGDFFRINKKPARSKLKVKDCTISRIKEDGLYAINFKKDLAVGEYEIEVRLDNGRKAIFNFEVKDFGTAKELVLSYPQKYVELGALSAKPTIKFIDENGVRKDATNYVTLGSNGYAVKHFNKNNGVILVKNDEKYLGDTITVTAIAEKEGLIADAELVVTDGKGGNETLTFDKKSGPVDVTNRVQVQVVDAKGNPIALGRDKVIQSMSPVVVEKSNDDAKVTASIGSVSKTSLQKDGTAELLLHSDKATDADVKVTIVAQSRMRGAIHTAYYRGTLHYVFSDKAASAERTVVMTINSNQVIVDNDIITIDTAAIIKNDRTFVPFRALAEAFDADVKYQDGVITAKLEGKNVEMTVDKTAYKVNGEEATMDVAPFIQDDRTMIPVRFAAEALGFKVTPTYHDNGTTASVAFQK